MSQGLNRISIIGYLGRQPESSESGSVTRFSVGVTEHWRDTDGNDKEHTEWFRVVSMFLILVGRAQAPVWDSFNGVAAACAEYLTRGRQVYVEGRLRTRIYTNRNDEEKTVTELLAQSVIFLGIPRANDEDREEPPPKPGMPRRVPKGVVLILDSDLRQREQPSVVGEALIR